MAGAISVKSSWTTLLSVMVVSTRRRAARSPRLAKVIIRSASGAIRLALVSVVVMDRCVNSCVARLASMSRSWAGPPPSRGPFVGVGMACFSSERVGLELLVLGERHVVVRTEAVDDQAGVEPGRAVLEGQAHAVQLGLDLVDGLGAEVTDVQQIGFTATDELTHGVDALALEAVVRPDGEVQFLDRQRQVGRQRGVRRRRAHVNALGLEVELPG